MEIRKEQSGDSLTIALVGRLDAVTAPDLDKVIQSSLDGIANLVFDCKELVYIASI